MNNKKYILIFLCLFLAACSNVTVPEIHEKEEARQTPELSPSSDTDITGDGTLRMSMLSPNTLNPLLNTDESVDAVLRLMFEPLYMLDNNLTPVPNLAESSTASRDGKAVSVKVKEGAKWWDGESITADDIVYSVEVLKSAPADSIYKSCGENMLYATKDSEYIATIYFSSPVGCPENRLCFPLIPKHHYSKGNVNMYPIGNGFYKFSNYTYMREMNLEACPCFKGEASIKNINISILTNKQAVKNAFESGITDIIDLPPSESTKTAKSDDCIAAYNTNNFLFLAFNLRQARFSDESIRTALARLIPTEDIVRNVYVDRAVKSITPINPANSLVDKALVQNYDYDKNMAQTILFAEGRSGEELKFEILVNNEDQSKCAVADRIGDAFKDAGIPVTVKKTDYATYTELLKKGEFDAYIGEVRLRDDYNLFALLHSSSVTSGINYSGFKDVYMDKLISQCNTAKDKQTYTQALNELNKYCSIKLPIIGICFPCNCLTFSPGIKSEKNPSLNNIYANINNWTIER
ncbi:MAG: ABC transporter substrate-binding protein [Firmicutes bacterium]|nr:ABC transporter substrate-binding protein [Bacillota bacterium]